MKNEYNQPFKDKLLDNDFQQSLGIEKTVITNMFKDHESGFKDNKWPLFSLYSLAIWFDNESKN